jgi:hypothetical protein
MLGSNWEVSILYFCGALFMALVADMRWYAGHFVVHLVFNSGSAIIEHQIHIVDDCFFRSGGTSGMMKEIRCY